MKVTKVDKIRIGVSGIKTESAKRGMLYKTETAEQKTIEEQIDDRVYRANKMYNLFFKQTYEFVLERHFSEIVKLAQTSDSVDVFKRELINYQGYEHNGRFIEVKRFRYKTKNYSFHTEMELHIRERLCDEWQKECYKAAAMDILKCICNYNFHEKVANLEEEKLDAFYEVSKCKVAPYISEDTKELERNFSLILKQLAWKADYGIEKQITWLEELKEIKVRRGVFVKIEEMKYPYATEDRMDAVLVRMRRSLKKGENIRVANMMLRGLAQGNFSALITEMKNDEKEYEALRYFIESLNKDYHKKDLIKSVENHDVKVQVYDETLDLSSVNVEKSSAKKKNREQLNMTLLRYASSPENADAVLLQIKQVMLEYFVWNSNKVQRTFLKPERLWDLPKREIQFFDNEFEPIDKNKEEKPEAMITLAEMWQQENVLEREVRARINYVNCGKYQQMIAALDKKELSEEEVEFHKYWIGYIKDYVERNYVRVDKDKKNQKKKIKQLTKEACCTTMMLSECWKDSIRFLCGKYIDIGKAVYHFAMPEDMKPTDNKCYGVLNDAYKDGISSFVYENIKAEENLQRSIADTATTAMAYFAKSAVDVEKHNDLCRNSNGNKEDIMFLTENNEVDEFKEVLKNSEVVRKQLLRYYGGQSNVEHYEEIDGHDLAKELLGHLKAIRNDSFHYTSAKETHLKADCTNILWENEIRAYHDETKKKYYSNNISLFYEIDDIKNLYETLYQKNEAAEAFIPSFRTTWKRQDLPIYLEPIVNKYLPDITELDQSKFEAAIYFLLKEVYYRDFILREETLQDFYDAVERYAEQFKPYDKKERYDRNRKKSPEEIAADHFLEYVESYKKDETVTFGVLSHAILSEGHSSKNQEEGYKHFAILFPRCVRNAFQKYVHENHKFLLEPKRITEKIEGDFLKDAAVGKIDRDENQLHWYTFAHFIPPAKLNHLIGEFKSYAQYKQDIFKRAKNTGQMENEIVLRREEALLEQSINKTNDILAVLEFVKNTVGRVSVDFLDYYENEEEYAEYLSNYINFDVKAGQTKFDAFSAFCQNTLEDGATLDIYYANGKPRIVPNIELLRMYSSSDVMNLNYKKIEKDELVEYYRTRDSVAEVMSTVLRKTKKQREDIVKFQQLKNRITLYEVTAIYELLNDLLGQLVSLSYLRERDHMYLLLGFYYMALRNKNGWVHEELNEANGKKIQVQQGLVLYQVISLFDFRTKIVCKNENDEWIQKGGNKWVPFICEHGMEDVETEKKDVYNMSLNCARRLFQKEEFVDDILELRNFIEHAKYYRAYEKSILELYGEFYTNFFGYSKKLRKSVMFNFKSVLEKYFLEADVMFIENPEYDENAERQKQNKLLVQLNGDIKSKEFTYKYYDECDRSRTLTLPVKTEAFVNCAKELLGYKNKG